MVVILINQIRKDLSNTVYVKDIATGGNALEHNKSLDIFLRRAAKIEWPTKEEKDYIGHTIHATLLKCTHTMKARDGDEIEFSFMKGRGFDNEFDACRAARDRGLVTEAGRGKWVYTPASGEPVEVQAGRWTVDLKMKEEISKSGRMVELLTWYDTLPVGNAGVVEEIKLDKEAEAEED
jgi:hypothetical protein